MQPAKWMLLTGAASLAVALSFAVLRPASAADMPPLVLPNWAAIFNSDGSLKDDLDADGLPVPNGVADAIESGAVASAEFIQDNFSDGIATDMSALERGDDLIGSIVFNGLVDGTDDIGNVYAATKGSGIAMQLFVGVERLDKGEDGGIDIEVNQGFVGVRSGAPWPILGARRDGDLLIRLSFSRGILSQVALAIWQGGSFIPLHNTAVTGDLCGGIVDQFMACGSVPPITSSPPQVWDLDFESVESAAANAFVEVGVAVGAILSEVPAGGYRTLTVSTLEDISIGGFGG